ncbi:MAG: ATP-binding protein [Syntrophales bacterium]
MNPCPCGYYTDQTRACRCTAQQIRQYQGRISGPLLDRIDIHIDVPSVRYKVYGKVFRRIIRRHQGKNRAGEVHVEETICRPEHAIQCEDVRQRDKIILYCR